MNDYKEFMKKVREASDWQIHSETVRSFRGRDYAVEIEYSPGYKQFAGRIMEKGMTAYGDTWDEAVNEVMGLLAKYTEIMQTM